MASLSSAYVGGTGWFGWDATSFISGEKNAGQTYSSIQLRGASESNTNCGASSPNYDWNTIFFYGPTSGSPPYLAVNYCKNNAQSCVAASDCCSGFCTSSHCCPAGYSWNGAACILPNGAQYISQSVPASMFAGQSYSVTVTMKNNGGTTWTPASSYRLGSQNPGDNTVWGAGRVNLGGGDSIGSGVSKSFTFNAVAPATPGTYNFQWRMVQDGVEWFGDYTPNVAVAVCYGNVHTCSAGTDCCSGNCKSDYSGGTKYCAVATDCVHSGVIYSNGATAPDCCDAAQRRYCNSGSWACTSCGASYWGGSYQCSGQQPQRDYHTVGCSAGSCYDNSAWQNNGAACTGGENSRCSGGSCQNYCANGLDDDGDGFKDGQDTDCGGCGQCTSGACCNTANGCFLSGKQGCGTCQQCSGASSSCGFVGAGADPNNECPGAFGTCTGANCNGAGACQYLAAGKQGCGTCQYCTGSGFACSSVALGSDPYSDCTPSWNSCSSTCIKTGPDGNCNGAVACNAGGASANVAAGNICSAGSEIAGLCNASWYCSNAQNTDNAYHNGGTGFFTQGTCDGGGVCDRSGPTVVGDNSSNACACIMGAANYWSIGGEVDTTGCCGDQAGEYRVARVCSSGCTTNATDDGCCSAATDCVYSSTCYDGGWTGQAPWNASLRVNCSSGSWNLVEDCSVKPSSDTDGGNVPAVAGTVTDYSTAGPASCNYNTYADLCVATTQLTEYYNNSAGYASQTYSCPSVEVAATDTDGGDNPAVDGTCTGGKGATCSGGAFTLIDGAGGSDTCDGTCGSGLNGCQYLEYYPADSSDGCPGLDTCLSKYYDADTNSNACSKCMGSGYWNIGGSVDPNGCCGDDAGEVNRARDCVSGCTTDNSDRACCASAGACVFSGTCFSDGNCNGNVKCSTGSWIDHCANGIRDCGETSVDCGGSCSCQYNVTLKYSVSDDKGIASCSLWTDSGGSWQRTQTSSNVVNGAQNSFKLTNVPTGSYRWTVNCTDSKGQTTRASNTVSGYWTFNVGL